MNDPRSKRFYQLQKKGLPNLTVAELKEVAVVAEKMMLFVKDPKSRRSWKSLVHEIGKRLEELDD